MKKNVLIYAFLGLFFCMCLVLSLGTLVFGPSRAGANERLSELPVPVEEGRWNTEYLAELSQWVNDRFFLRQELISLNNWLSARVLGTSGEEDVILGKEGWLYYGSTLNDYCGLEPMTQRELFSAANNLALMQRYCVEQGKGFAFVIAPNKNSLYPQYMPDYGVTAARPDAQRLLEALEARGVNAVDLFAPFRAQAQQLYFAHDSHWNSQGAALGADLINAAFGIESSFFAGDFSGETAHDGDLYAMVYPAWQDPETDPVYGGELVYSFTGKLTKPDSITLETAGAGNGRLLAYRDSFGNLLFPYLAHSYASCRFSRSTSYDLTLEADYVLVELVERNLRYLITYLPVMPSPQVQLTLPEALSGTARGEVSEKAKAPEGTVLITGTLPRIPDSDSPVYLVSGEGAYEAFCLTGDSFGAYLPEASEGKYLVYTVGGEPLMFEIEFK